MHTGTTIKDKILVVGKALKATSIQFASRIANNRICMYPAGKTFADNLTSDNSNILTKDRLIFIDIMNKTPKCQSKANFSLQRLSYYFS